MDTIRLRSLQAIRARCCHGLPATRQCILLPDTCLTAEVIHYKVEEKKDSCFKKEVLAMIVRTSEALWEGNIKKGKGTVKLGSGNFEGNYSFGSRFEHATGTNPEELIGAAHAGCFNMAFALMLDQKGYSVNHIHTVAKVSIDKVGEGYKILTSELETECDVPGIDEKTCRDIAEQAKNNCPVSLALTGVNIKLVTRLVKRQKAA